MRKGLVFGAWKLWLLALAATMVCACSAPGGGSVAEADLLTRELQTLSDAELVDHERELERRLAHEEDPGVYTGLGVGVWGGNVGVGVHTDISRRRNEALHQRLFEVREEMRRRGLTGK